MSAPASTDKPWGHKVTMHVYVPGDITDAITVSDALSDAVNADGFPMTDFAGITVSVVDGEPRDQVAS